MIVDPAKGDLYEVINILVFNCRIMIAMDLNDFIKHFAEQLEDTDACDIKADTVFKDLDEWSSLMALSIIAMVDEEYDVRIKGDDIRQATTIEDLYNVVKSRK